MIHLVLPFALASILAGAGVYAILARRNAVLMLIGVELVLASANLVLVTASAVLPDPHGAGQIVSLFVITLAAAEVTLALGIILFAFRARGHIDLGSGLHDDEARADVFEAAPQDAPQHGVVSTQTGATAVMTQPSTTPGATSTPETKGEQTP